MLSAAAAVMCLGICGWLAWGEWGPDGRAQREPREEMAAGERTPVQLAREYAATRRWEDVQVALRDVGPDDPDGEEAAALRAKALMERRNRDVYARLKRQLVDEDHAGARETLRVLPKDSVYRAEAVRMVRNLE